MGNKPEKENKMTLEEWAERLETPEQAKLRKRLRWLVPLQIVAEAIGFVVAFILIIAAVFAFATAFS